MPSNHSALYRIKNKLKWPQATRGLGMIELIVAISIMIIVSAVILARQNSFNGAVLLRSEAYEIALRLREVQLSAVSVTNRDSSADDFRTALGVYFNSNSGNNNFYPVYRDDDLENDGFYDNSERFGEQGRIDDRFEVREIRVGESERQHVSIVFQRPNFDALFYTAPGAISDVASVEIDIARKGVATDGEGDVRTIEVTSTGQIGVK